MSGSVKLGLYILLAVVGVTIVFKIVGAIVGLLMPILIIGGIALVIVGLVSGRRALGGGRRTLP